MGKNVVANTEPNYKQFATTSSREYHWLNQYYATEFIRAVREIDSFPIEVNHESAGCDYYYCKSLLILFCPQL